MSTMTTDPTFGIDAEAHFLSRLLSALATYSNLHDALMSFHADLPENEAILRSSLVLKRMDEMLPADVVARLRKTNSHTNQSASQIGTALDQQLTLVELLTILVCLVASAVGVALSIIGGIATYHYLVATYHTFQSGSTMNQILRNVFFS